MKSIFCLLVCLFTASANANLITNGDFSTLDITGWTLTGGERSDVASEGFFREYDNSGWAVLSQDIATVSGASYDISFDTYASYVAGNQFAWAIDGVLSYITTTTDWVTTLGTFSATGASTNVAFYMATDIGTGTWRLDNIMVDATVPEPGSLILLSLGLIGLGLSRKKQAA